MHAVQADVGILEVSAAVAVEIHAARDRIARAERRARRPAPTRAAVPRPTPAPPGATAVTFTRFVSVALFDVPGAIAVAYVIVSGAVSVGTVHVS